MNPNRGGEQPTSQFEVAPLGSENYSETPGKTAEQIKTPESSPSRQSAPPALVPQMPVVQNQPVVPASGLSTDNATAVPVTPGPDRIEKQWVEKAKAVIAQTKDDPFTQKNEMSKVKAAYIEKRFNKKVKTDEAIT